MNEQILKGTQVYAFHRYSQDENGYFMVEHHALGCLHPAIGKTDGWTQAKVVETWNPKQYNSEDINTWVKIQWLHPDWYDRSGIRLSNNPDFFQQHIMPTQISLTEPKRPVASLLFVRWGGSCKVDPVIEGSGGWGTIGATCSDNFINAFEKFLFKKLGPNYEIISVFVQNSQDLRKLSVPSLRMLLSYQYIGAFYFLWPTGYADGHDYPAYVEREALLAHMHANEASGIPTLFPACASLYKFFASKDWTVAHCLNASLAVPLTVRVSRNAIAVSATEAALSAQKALQILQQSRGCHNSIEANGSASEQGVAKLGWSWEAQDVRFWNSNQDLARYLSELVNQPGCELDNVFVQEWVPFDVEMRCYVIDPKAGQVQSWLPQGRVFTKMKTIDERTHCFTDIVRYTEPEVIEVLFNEDVQSYEHAKQRCDHLIQQWMLQILAENVELPSVIRFDFMLKYDGPGKIRVKLGELTEPGACFLGWEEGPRLVFQTYLNRLLNIQEDAAWVELGLDNKSAGNAL